MLTSTGAQAEWSLICGTDDDGAVARLAELAADGRLVDLLGR